VLKSVDEGKFERAVETTKSVDVMEKFGSSNGVMVGARPRR
jgi:hypothetical protein